eukprot:5785835-Amphidinium_carterae.1
MWGPRGLTVHGASCECELIAKVKPICIGGARALETCDIGWTCHVVLGGGPLNILIGIEVGCRLPDKLSRSICFTQSRDRVNLLQTCFLEVSFNRPNSTMARPIQEVDDISCVYGSWVLNLTNGTIQASSLSSIVKDSICHIVTEALFQKKQVPEINRRRLAKRESVREDSPNQ